MQVQKSQKNPNVRNEPGTTIKDFGVHVHHHPTFAGVASQCFQKLWRLRISVTWCTWRLYLVEYGAKARSASRHKKQPKKQTVQCRFVRVCWFAIFILHILKLVSCLLELLISFSKELQGGIQPQFGPADLLRTEYILKPNNTTHLNDFMH